MSAATEPERTQRLCVKHSHLHGGKPAHLSDPRKCDVCHPPTEDEE